MIQAQTLDQEEDFMIKWFTEKKLKWLGGGWPIIVFRCSPRRDKEGRKLLYINEIKTIISKSKDEGFDGISIGVKK